MQTYLHIIDSPKSGSVAQKSIRSGISKASGFSRASSKHSEAVSSHVASEHLTQASSRGKSFQGSSASSGLGDLVDEMSCDSEEVVDAIVGSSMKHQIEALTKRRR